MTAVKQEQLLTVDEVAYRLQVTNAQVLKLRRTGALPAINVSAGAKPNYRWRPSVLETFLRTRRAA